MNLPSNVELLPLLLCLGELSFNMHVRDVDYVENGCERLTGTLYMTTFRLVFAPDNEIENRSVVSAVQWEKNRLDLFVALDIFRKQVHW